MKPRHLLFAALPAAILLCAPAAPAQTLYGVDPFGGLVWEFTMPPGGACAAPAYFPPPWPYPVPAPCAVPPPPPLPVGFNSIAVNKLTDTVFVCDGFTIEEYLAGSPIAGPPGTPIDAYLVPPLPPMGPVVGMCWDAAGGVLFITDGLFIAGLALAPGGCLAPPVVIPPFPHGLGPGVLSDITWDPFTGGGTLWATDITFGIVANILVGGGVGPGGAFAPGFAAPIVGIAYDSATPVLPPAPPTAPHVFVTDGITVVYFDTVTTFPSATTPFYVPVPVGPVPVPPISSLAYSGHGTTYGPPPGVATLSTFGQSSSPGPTFGLMLTGGTVGDFIWVVANYSFPGPGFLCPPATTLSNPLWVSTAPPALVSPFAPVVASPMVIPAALGAGLPPGLTVFVQFWMDSTPAALGGPWLSTDPVEFTIMMP